MTEDAPSSTTNRWGDDSGLPEDHNAIWKDLMFLGLIAGSGGTTAAVNDWWFGARGFHLDAFIASIVFGALCMGFFARSRSHPWLLGLLMGSFSGSFAYLASTFYISFRHKLRLYELAIPSMLGALPGLLLYVLLVKLYFRWTEPTDGD